MVKSIERSVMLGMMEKMLMIRRLEESVRDLFANGEIKGFVHLAIGQEAIPAGVCAHLRADDYITSTHRGHGHLLAKGGDPGKAMAELFGKETGYCKGLGGSMHVADAGIGILGANGIVGAGTVIAVGAGLTAQYLDTGQVVACFFGDGASNQGMFHEGANMAALWKLPIIYVCENNGYGEFTPRHLHQTVENISARAAAYNMPSETVDGDDAVAVYKAAGEAIAWARSGKGPVLLECVTHRWRGHYEGDPQSYRDPGELKSLDQHCPIARLKKSLIREGIISGKEYDDLEARVRKDIEKAVEFARQSPAVDLKDLADYIYAD